MKTWVSGALGAGGMIDMQRTGNYYGTYNTLFTIAGNIAGSGLAAGTRDPGNWGYAAKAAGVHAAFPVLGGAIGYA